MSDEKFYDSDESDSESEEKSYDEEEEGGKKKKKKNKIFAMDSDHRLLLRVTKPLLQSRNAAVSY